MRKIREGEKRRDPADRMPVLVCSDRAMPRMPGITAVCARAKARAASARIAVALCLGWLAGWLCPLASVGVPMHHGVVAHDSPRPRGGGLSASVLMTAPI